MDSTHRNALLKSLAITIADYRLNEIAPITPAHVEKWLNQFEPTDQPVILTEMLSIMQRFYFSRAKAKDCLRNFLKIDVIGAHNSEPLRLLAHVDFLHLQHEISSQEALLQLVDEILNEDYNFSLDDCGTASVHTYIYIDDASYTGSRLRYDMTTGAGAPAWIVNTAPPNCKLFIYNIAFHTGAQKYAMSYINQAAQRKSIGVYKREARMIDTRRLPGSKVEFLWPDSVPNDPAVSSYMSRFYPVRAEKNWRNDIVLRGQGIPNQETLFPSPDARKIIEKAFLLKGSQIINVCRNPSLSMRPLGFEKIPSLGFGTFFVTYQNISNNCPLVLWWGNPTLPATHPLSVWYPLFPRRTNVQSQMAIRDIITEDNLLDDHPF